MQLNYSIQNNTIYDHRGRELPADEKGIVKLVIDNQERRFIKEKVINFLSTNPFVKMLKPRPTKIIAKKAKVVSIRERQPPKPRKKETVPRKRFGTQLSAVKDGITYGPFKSINYCANGIGISKSTISKILNGKQVNMTGWIFKKL